MIVFLILASTAVLCIAAYYYSWKTFSFFKNTGIPYVQPSLLVGNIGPTIMNRQQIGELLQDLYHRFPDAKYVGMFDCLTPILLIRDPNLIKSITIKNFDYFSDHLGFTTEADKNFFNSIFSLRGQRWRDMRSLLSPCFTSLKMKQMFQDINDIALNFTDSLLKDSETGLDHLDVKDICGRYTVEIMCKFFFGINVNATGDPQNEVYKNGRKTFAFNGPLSWRFFLIKHFQWIVKKLKISLFDEKGAEYFNNMIKATIAARDQQGIVHSDMLQVLMDTSRNAEARIKIDMSDILSQTFIFIFGGFDTTSSYLSHTFHCLATFPETQRRLQEEIDEVLMKSDGKPTYEDINSMKYLEAVITEGGRMYGSVPYVERMCTRDFELPPAVEGAKPYTVKPGMGIYLPIFATHRDPKIYNNPLEFDPTRHLGKSSDEAPLFMPFGIGPRACIGTRLAYVVMKVIIFHMLAKSNLKPTEGTQVPMKFVNSSFVLMCQNGVRLKMERRN